MKLKTTIMLAVAAAMVGMVQTAQASFVEDTLADLMASPGGGSLAIGDKTFSGFDVIAESGLTTYNPANIEVIATELTPTSYTLTWSGNIGLAGAAGTPSVTADLSLQYTVTATGGAIGSIDQSYTGGVAPPNAGTLTVTETAYVGATQVAKSTLDQTLSQEPPITYVGDNLIINPPESSLTVDKDIYLTIFPTSTSPASASISIIEQSFEEVPEASTMIAGALLVLPFGASALRILRRNRMA